MGVEVNKVGPTVETESRTPEAGYNVILTYNHSVLGIMLAGVRKMKRNTLILTILPVPQFPYLYNGNNNNTYFRVVL